MRKFLILPLLMVVIASFAQEDPEYKLELGGGIGTVTYLGDFNGNLTTEMQPWGTVMAKYRMNPRMSVGLSIGLGQLKGTSANVSTWYPEGPYEFSKRVMDVSSRYEYNFWAFGTGREYRGARRLAPFIALGLGVTSYGGTKSGMTANLPLGAGLKYKMGERLNLTAEWRIHFTMSDYLDDVRDPYGIESSGMFKNTDCFSVIQVGLTYDLWAKCKTCHNDRD